MQTRLYICGTGIDRIDGAQATFTEAPRGGYKHSGIGREPGHRGLDDYLETEQFTKPTSDRPRGWHIKG